jgi:ribosome recycling factor
MEPTSFVLEAKASFEKSLQHLKGEFAQIQAGQANTSLVEGILVPAYGSMSPLKNNASLSIPEPQTISIEPWDKSLLSAIEKAIRDSDLGLTPQNNGSGVLRLHIPPLTEERRKNLVKVVHSKTEEVKVSIRQIRQDALRDIRSLEGVSEDLIKQEEENLQKAVQDINEKIDALSKQKETDIMKV